MAILEHLGQRGASFLAAMQGATGLSTEVLVPALWDLAWAGRVTNDAFLPLRTLRARKRSRSGPARFAGGRWSLVEELRYREPSPTERSHGRSMCWFERYGVVSRVVPRAEGFEIATGILGGDPPRLASDAHLENAPLGLQLVEPSTGLLLATHSKLRHGQVTHPAEQIVHLSLIHI